MLQENVELVRRWFAAVARGELAPELWDPDLVVENVPEFPITGPYRGHAGLRHWWEELSEVVEGTTIDLDQGVALDEGRVLTVQRLVGAFSKMGIPVNQGWVAIFVVKEGKILSVSGYASRRRALEAVRAGPAVVCAGSHRRDPSPDTESMR